MHRFRTSRTTALIAGLLMASLLPGVLKPLVSPRVDAARQPAHWLRTQVQGPTGEDFDRAISAARAAEARTLQDFLSTFMEEYARRTGTEAVAASGRSAQALLQALRVQLARAGVRLPVQMAAPPAAPVRLLLVLAGASGGPVLERLKGFSAAERVADRRHGTDAVSLLLRPDVLCLEAGHLLLRTLFSARPLGP